MAIGQPGDIQKLSGVPQQFPPDLQQIVDGESQVATQAPSPLIELEEPEKRIAPSETGQYPPEPAEAIGEEGEAAVAAAPVKIDFPIVRWTRYAGADGDFRELLSWNIQEGYVGDLHEISLLSDNDAKTRFKLTIAGVDMQLPTDRTLATPITMPWRDTKLPGPASVLLEVKSTDGTTINVDGMITGTLRFGA
jgi:hypothetical protein